MDPPACCANSGLLSGNMLTFMSNARAGYLPFYCHAGEGAEPDSLCTVTCGCGGLDINLFIAPPSQPFRDNLRLARHKPARLHCFNSR